MSATLISFDLTGEGLGVEQDISIGESTLIFSSEGHRSFGGTDSAPRPLDLALGSLTSCTQVTSHIVTSQKSGIRLGRWKVGVEARLDAAVLVTGAGGLSNFRDVHLDIEIETNLRGQEFEDFAAEVERRRPVTHCLVEAG